MIGRFQASRSPKAGNPQLSRFIPRRFPRPFSHASSPPDKNPPHPTHPSYQEHALRVDLGLLSKRLTDRENVIRMYENYIRIYLQRNKSLPLKSLLQDLSKTIIRQDPNLDMKIFLVSIDEIDIAKGQGQEVLRQASFDDNNEIFKKPAWLFKSLRFLTLVLPGYLMAIRLHQAIPHFLYRKVVSSYWKDRCAAYFYPGNGNGPAPTFEFEGDIIAESRKHLKYRDGFKGFFAMVRRSIITFRYSLSFGLLAQDLSQCARLFGHALNRVHHYLLARFMLRMASIYLGFCIKRKYQKTQFHFVVPLIIDQRLKALVYCVSFAKLNETEKEEVKANPKQYVAQFGEALSNQKISLISSTRKPNFDVRSYAHRMAEEMFDRRKANAKQRIWFLDPFFLFESFASEVRKHICEQLLSDAFPGLSSEQAAKEFSERFKIEPEEENIFYVALRNPEHFADSLPKLFTANNLLHQQRGPILHLMELVKKGYVDRIATTFPGEGLGFAMIQPDLFSRNRPKKSQFKIWSLRGVGNLRGIQALDRAQAQEVATALQEGRPGVFVLGYIMAQDFHLIDFLRRHLQPGLHLKWVDANPQQAKFQNSLSRPIEADRQARLFADLDKTHKGLLSVEELDTFLRHLTERIAQLEREERARPG